MSLYISVKPESFTETRNGISANELLQIKSIINSGIKGIIATPHHQRYQDLEINFNKGVIVDIKSLCADKVFEHRKDDIIEILGLQDLYELSNVLMKIEVELPAGVTHEQITSLGEFRSIATGWREQDFSSPALDGNDTEGDGVEPQPFVPKLIPGSFESEEGRLYGYITTDVVGQRDILEHKMKAYPILVMGWGQVMAVSSIIIQKPPL